MEAEYDGSLRPGAHTDDGYPPWLVGPGMSKHTLVLMRNTGADMEADEEEFEYQRDVAGVAVAAGACRHCSSWVWRRRLLQEHRQL